MSAEILQPFEAHIQRCAEKLRAGGVVAFPTETVYGLGASIFREEALAKVFSVKERPTFDPLIVHVAPGLGGVDRFPPKGSTFLHWLERLELVAPGALSMAAFENAEALMHQFWPGPLTLVLPKHPRVPDLATAGLSSVGIRCPAHPVAQQLIRAAGVPLAAPSANRFGKISPTCASDVRTELGERIEFILDGGRCGVGLESSVVLVEPEGDLVLLRPGGISAEEIEGATALGGTPVKLRRGVGADFLGPQTAPGLLKSHYAPERPIKVLENQIENLSPDQLESLSQYIAQAEVVGVLVVAARGRDMTTLLKEKLKKTVVVKVLTPTQDLSEAARGLFGALRLLDVSHADVLLAEPSALNEGLGLAINDRLQKAGYSAQ